MPKTKLIYKKQSRIHATGVFAAEPISKGTKVVPYTGRKISNSRSRKKKNQDYLFELNRKYDIDGLNIARYVNHSCEPNCEADVIRGQIWISAIRDIKKDEELSYNYRYLLEDGLKYPCRCGSKKCPGYILAEEEWPKFRRLKQKGRLKIPGSLA